MDQWASTVTDWILNQLGGELFGAGLALCGVLIWLLYRFARRRLETRLIKKNVQSDALNILVVDFAGARIPFLRWGRMSSQDIGDRMVATLRDAPAGIFKAEAVTVGRWSGSLPWPRGDGGDAVRPKTINAARKLGQRLGVDIVICGRYLGDGLVRFCAVPVQGEQGDIREMGLRRGEADKETALDRLAEAAALLLAANDPEALDDGGLGVVDEARCHYLIEKLPLLLEAPEGTVDQPTWDRLEAIYLTAAHVNFRWYHWPTKEAFAALVCHVAARMGATDALAAKRHMLACRAIVYRSSVQLEVDAQTQPILMRLKKLLLASPSAHKLDKEGRVYDLIITGLGAEIFDHLRLDLKESIPEDFASKLEHPLEALLAFSLAKNNSPSLEARAHFSRLGENAFFLSKLLLPFSPFDSLVVLLELHPGVPLATYIKDEHRVETSTAFLRAVDEALSPYEEISSRSRYLTWRLAALKVEILGSINSGWVSLPVDAEVNQLRLLAVDDFFEKTTPFSQFKRLLSKAYFERGRVRMDIPFLRRKALSDYEASLSLTGNLPNGGVRGNIVSCYLNIAQSEWEKRKSIEDAVQGVTRSVESGMKAARDLLSNLETHSLTSINNTSNVWGYLGGFNDLELSIALTNLPRHHSSDAEILKICWSAVLYFQLCGEIRGSLGQGEPTTQPLWSKINSFLAHIEHFKTLGAQPGPPQPVPDYAKNTIAFLDSNRPGWRERVLPVANYYIPDGFLDAPAPAGVQISLKPENSSNPAAQ